MKTERYTEALYDPSTNLTYPALTGQRKQSIRDVEALFSKGVEDFMKRKGYKVEEEYIRAIIDGGDLPVTREDSPNYSAVTTTTNFFVYC